MDRRPPTPGRAAFVLRKLAIKPKNKKMPCKSVMICETFPVDYFIKVWYKGAKYGQKPENEKEQKT